STSTTPAASFSATPIAPADAVAEFAKPISAPASSVKQSQASFNAWVVATPATTTAVQTAGPSS
ncbi:hypothetical protein E4U39_005632, partial [Claviceps sp. Clav50 group G5]